jgi:hypothetical protein
MVSIDSYMNVCSYLLMRVIDKYDYCLEQYDR